MDDVVAAPPGLHAAHPSREPGLPSLRERNRARAHYSGYLTQPGAAEAPKREVPAVPRQDELRRVPAARPAHEDDAGVDAVRCAGAAGPRERQGRDGDDALGIPEQSCPHHVAVRLAADALCDREPLDDLR